jgi:hypothetical protein
VNAGEKRGGFETDSERIPRRLAAGLASEYKKTIPYVKIPCGLCRRVLHLCRSGPERAADIRDA